MKIHTRTVIDMSTGEILEDESYEYEGPVSEAKGGGGGTTTIQKADPWSGVQPYLKSGYAQLGELAGQTPQFYPGQTYAGFAPEQTAAHEAIAQYASGALPNQIQQAFGTQSFLLDPTGINSRTGQMMAGAGSGSNLNLMGMRGNTGQTDMAIQQMLQAGINPYTQELAQQGLRDIATAFEGKIPGIEMDALMAGGYGGSRQGIAEGMAAQTAIQEASDFVGNLYSGAYDRAMDTRDAGAQLAADVEASRTGFGADATGQALDYAGKTYGQDMSAMLGALGMAPQTYGMGTMPAELMYGIGSDRQTMQQNAINQDMAKWEFEQNAPWERVQQYLATLSGAPGGTTTTTGPNPNQGSWLSNGMTGAMGGAAAAAGLGALGGGMGAGLGTLMSAANPLFLPLTIGGGLLGAFG